MTSRASSQASTLAPDSPKEDLLREERSYRRETVYDAVAERIAATGFIPKHQIISSTRDTASSTTVAAAPESVLFRRKDAPTRYAESDIYFAKARDLKTELPESDLLKALHSYSSDFYSRATPEAGVGDWRSMDETALIALGVLMEEFCKETLGQTGDLVFTEGEDLGGRARAPSVLSTNDVQPSKVRPSKRRKIIEG